MASCCVETQMLTSYCEPPDTAPLSPSLTTPPHNTAATFNLLLCFQHLLFSLPGCQTETYPFVCICHFIGASFPNKESSILLTNIGALLSAFRSRMECRWPGESYRCGRAPVFNLCSSGCPWVRTPGLCFPRARTSGPSGGGGGLGHISFFAQCTHTTSQVRD